jgi:hypothetical protein
LYMHIQIKQWNPFMCRRELCHEGVAEIFQLQNISCSSNIYSYNDKKKSKSTTWA